MDLQYSFVALIYNETIIFSITYFKPPWNLHIHVVCTLWNVCIAFMRLCTPLSHSPFSCLAYRFIFCCANVLLHNIPYLCVVRLYGMRFMKCVCSWVCRVFSLQCLIQHKNRKICILWHMFYMFTAPCTRVHSRVWQEIYVYEPLALYLAFFYFLVLAIPPACHNALHCRCVICAFPAAIHLFPSLTATAKGLANIADCRYMLTCTSDVM